MYTRFCFIARSLCLTILMLGCATVFAQKTDSLKSVLARQKNDTVYTRTLVNIAKAYNNSNPDSCLRYALLALQHAKDMRAKYLEIPANMYIGYAWYMKGDYDKSIAGFREQYNAAAAISDFQNMAVGINNEANAWIEKGNYSQAMDNYRQSLKICQDHNDDYGVARAYNNISYVNKELGNYSVAIENYIAALKIFEGKKLNREASQCYDNIGMVYYRQKDYPSALEYTQKALDIQKENDYQGGMAISLEMLSNIYGMQKKYAEAIGYSRQALALHQNKKDTRQVAINNANMAELFSRQGTYDSAILYYTNAVRLNREMNNKRSLPTAYNGCASALISNHQLPAAKNMLDSSKAILDETGRKEDVREYYAVLAAYYAAMGNPAEALSSYKISTDIKDSILNEENTKIISEINTKYETEKKQTQIEKLGRENAQSSLTIKDQQLTLNKRLYELAENALKLSGANLKLAQDDVVLKTQEEKILRNRIDSIQAGEKLEKISADNKLQQLAIKNQELTIARKNILFIVSVIIFALLLLLGYISYRRYKLKQKNRTQALLMEQQDLAAQEVIQAEEKERRRIAADLHDGVGQIMSAAKMNLSAIQNQLNFTTEQQRLMFANAIAMVDDSCKEVREISHQMMPNALLKAGLVAAVREFVHRISNDVLRIQLHAEGLGESMEKNTEIVLYRVLQECVQNVIKHAKASHLDISLIKDEDGISITIEDNGKGFDTSKISGFTGLGLSNMIKRVEYLKGTIEWSSGVGKGTLVSIHVPA